jgi:N-acetylglucosaminyl-diphospho-decaprenol L-rhamnosyltransferase
VRVDDVSVVVVTFQSREIVAACLDSLQEPPPKGIVVVDNASDDGTAAFVRERFPTAQVLSLPENVGFGAAANTGVDATDTPYVLVLNPDARPLGDSLEKLAACAATNLDAAVIAPTLVDEAGRAQPSRIGYPTPLWTGTPAVTSFPSRRSGAAGSDGFAVGAAFLLRREAFRAVGGFDPDFFLFYEEVDLCLRLERAGWSIVSCPGATFVHAGGAATRIDWSESYRRQLCGHLRFMLKHRGPAAAERSRRLLVAAVGLRALVARGDVRAAARSAFPWLRGGSVAELLEDPGSRK